MAHECPECGQQCYCDCDDTFMESGSDDCVCGHGAQYGCTEPDGSDLRDEDDDRRNDEDEDEAYYVALEEHWNAVQLPAPPTPEKP